MVTIADKGIKPFISTANAGSFFYVALPEPDETAAYHFRIKHKPNTNSYLLMYAFTDDSQTGTDYTFRFTGNQSTYYSTTDTGYTSSLLPFIYLQANYTVSNLNHCVTDVWLYSTGIDGNLYPSVRWHTGYNNASYTCRGEGNAVLVYPTNGSSSDKPRRLRFNTSTQTAVTEINGWQMGR